MTIKNIIALVIALSLTRVCVAQSTDEPTKYKQNNNFDLSLASNANQQLGALSWVHFHSITKNKKFKIGYGIRFNAQQGKNLSYYTAPAILTSKQTGPQVLFSETYYDNVDTFVVANSKNNSLNLSINLQYSFTNKFEIGFNIDAIGFAFGKKTNGKYVSFRDKTNAASQPAKPTKFNALLVSDNDIGMLNSELYARYWFNKNWAIKAGAAFLFTEYTTTNKLRLNNDRWRNKGLLPMIAVTYNPFKN